MRQTLVATLVCAILLPQGASAKVERLLRVDPEIFFEASSPHFRLITDLEEAQARRYANRLQGFVQVVASQTNIENLESREPIRIFAFRSREGFWYAGGGASRLGGFMTRSPRGFFLSITPSILGREILFHEYTHFLTFNGSLGYPTWFVEGFAELLSTVQIRDGIATIGALADDRRPTLMNAKSLLPLREVLSLTEYPKKVFEFYAQAWLLTHYLHTARHEGRAKRLAQMQHYLGLMNQNREWEAAFDEAFDVSIEELEEEVNRYRERLLQPGAHTPVVSVDLGEVDMSAVRFRKLTAAEAAEGLGELNLSLSTKKRWDQAARFFVYSRRRDPSRANALAGLAEVQALRGDFKKATHHLARLRREAPGTLRLSLAVGRVQSLLAARWRKLERTDRARDATESARKAYRVATEINAHSAEAWIGLAYTFAETDDDPEEGIDAFERGLELVLPKGSDSLALAKLHHRAGNRDRYGTLLRTTLQWASGDVAEEARELLDDLTRERIAEAEAEVGKSEDDAAGGLMEIDLPGDAENSESGADSSEGTGAETPTD